MLGQFPVERMPSFFAHADALLVSLKQEPVFSLTIPGKMQAYLASGIPVLAMLDGEGAAVVRQSGAGLACPAGDSAGLAKAVRLMASMTPEQRSEMGNRGRDVTAREFNRIALIDQLESWLEQLHSRVPLSHETLVPK
jgi:glycosyltransferase involved in cell wall biosynthesis